MQTPASIAAASAPRTVLRRMVMGTPPLAGIVGRFSAFGLQLRAEDAHGAFPEFLGQRAPLPLLERDAPGALEIPREDLALDRREAGVQHVEVRLVVGAEGAVVEI